MDDITDVVIRNLRRWRRRANRPTDRDNVNFFLHQIGRLDLADSIHIADDPQNPNVVIISRHGVTRNEHVTPAAIDVAD